MPALLRIPKKQRLALPHGDVPPNLRPHTLLLATFPLNPHPRDALLLIHASSLLFLQAHSMVAPS